MKHSYYLGIDGGGSKCKARLEDAAGNLLGEYISGPANPMRDFNTAIHSINDVIKGVFYNAKLKDSHTAQTSAVIGLAGLNIPSCFDKVSQWQHPFAQLQLTTDLHIACVGAHEHEEGAIVIIGTGSSGIVCKNSQYTEFGGHGFMLGDKGSGAWYGMQCVRHVLEVLDGIQPVSLFARRLLKELNYGNAQDIVEHYAHTSPAMFAKLAPILFEYAELNESTALHIAQQGAEYINKLSEQILLHAPQRFAFIGGLSHKVIPWLPLKIQAKLSEPLNPPEVGAILIARQHIALGENFA